MMKTIVKLLLLVGLLFGLKYLAQSTGLLDAIWGDVSTTVGEASDSTDAPLAKEAEGEGRRKASKEKRSTNSPPSEPSPAPRPSPTFTPDKVKIPRGTHIHGDLTLLELPRLSEGKQNYFVTHRLASGEANYSLEYDVSRRHARWVAFTLDATSSAKANLRRTDAWQWDPIIPSAYSTETWFRGSGYSRGHLVASADRLASREANEQTFYYSNVSPQLQEHNGGIWQRLEQWLQNLGRNARVRDVVYVAKGGTIRDDQVEPKRIKGEMVIPKYYYMAIVVEKAGRYQGLAFWTEHRDYERIPLRELSLSIDELERRTGLDFFPSFPEDLETSFERMTIADARWPGL